jgi:hypothetical protein
MAQPGYFRRCGALVWCYDYGTVWTIEKWGNGMEKLKAWWNRMMAKIRGGQNQTTRK